jgi:hypothetical protein
MVRFGKILKSGSYQYALSPALLMLPCLPLNAMHYQDRPNIILCMADNLGWGDLGYNGNPVVRTPNLDDMAASGLRLDNFYSASPTSSPARGSILTGRSPNRFGCFSYGGILRPQEITVAEALKTAGYVTGHFGKWHLGSVRSNSPVNPGASGFDEWLSSPNFFNNNPILSLEGKAVQLYGESSMVTVDAAIEFIRKQSGKKQPFLAVVWFASPHPPHEASDKDKMLYADQPEELQDYYGEITAMDRAVGKLREELKALGIYKNTILWFNADNGGNKGYSRSPGRGYFGEVYQGGIWVASVIEWPERIPVPGVTGVPCNTFDIYPTLLDITGIKMHNQPPLDGISLLPLFDKKIMARRKPMGFWQYPDAGKTVSSEQLMADLLKAQTSGINDADSVNLDLTAGLILKKYPNKKYPGHAAWIDWPLKLHRIESKEGVIKIELYNLEDDQGERNDLSLINRDRVNSMRSQLESWLISVVQSLNGDDYR